MLRGNLTGRLGRKGKGGGKKKTIGKMEQGDRGPGKSANHNNKRKTLENVPNPGGGKRELW